MVFIAAVLCNLCVKGYSHLVTDTGHLEGCGWLAGNITVMARLQEDAQSQCSSISQRLLFVKKQFQHNLSF